MAMTNNPEGSAMVGLLMTRPRAASEQFVEDLPTATRVALQVIYAPLIDAQPMNLVPFQLENGFYAGDVIFSSANAVQFAPQPAAGQRAYCVGERTTKTAQSAGWQALCCGQDADTLVNALVAAPPTSPVSHMRGVHSRGDIARRLQQAGVSCRELVIYDQILLSYDDDACRAIDAQSSLIVPLFSPRTARQFVKLAPYRSELHLIAFSEAVAEPLKSLKCNDLRICKSPTAREMLRVMRDAAAELVRVEGGPSAQ
ncbi:uroporphyrinogen-III synthase [Phaeobacter sp. C3_T13_0]|uniref:uroporphyrinogen-III synthase n=1 Tax=Phaeobacter cretensis TaxID=3342641 RepID=UPI0039BD33E6